ncbi:MAG: hypothetical protein JWL96_3883 [Sphingomonas bacterium]|uniref:hypothetical protein n=1 Tax=Sphingomonas bacterium TaxID=1895847 RepID=UPI0026231115|nr:hypothetical protein [Sphingomonas bacterium]MDB5711813.1 hypothetical protein [Sphingomonas bacterium]
MAESNGNKSRTEARRAWIEPTVTELNVNETAANPTLGPDGGPVYPDCSQS